MPRKRALRRVRLLRMTAWTASFAGLTGATVVLGAAPDAWHRQPDGLVGIGLGLVVALAGFAAVVRCLRADDRFAATEMSELRARGEDDQLPYGAYLRGNDVGLQASDQWLLYAALMTAVGVGFLVGGLVDARTGVTLSIAFSLVGFVPALVFSWLGTGTPYWLTEDRLVTRGPFRREVAWAEVERFRLSHRGSTVDDVHLADAIELQVADDRPLRWGALGITIRLPLVEASREEVLDLVQARCPNASILG